MIGVIEKLLHERRTLEKVLADLLAKYQRGAKRGFRLVPAVLDKKNARRGGERAGMTKVKTYVNEKRKQTTV